MKKGFKTMLMVSGALALSAVCAVGAFAAVTVDATKQDIPKSFVEQASTALAQMQSGKRIVPLYAPIGALTEQTLSVLLPTELKFLQETVPAYEKKAHALIDAQYQAATQAFVPIQSGSSVDLNGDGKAESVKFRDAQNGEYEVTITVGKSKQTLDAYRITGVYAVDIGIKQKALMVEVSGDSDYVQTYALFYFGDKKFTQAKDSFGRVDHLRQRKDGTFYSAPLKVPCNEVYSYELTTDSIKQKAKREQPFLHVVQPAVKTDYNDAYTIKLASLTGGTMTLKPGEKFSVLACEPVEKKADKDDEWSMPNSYVALVNAKGEVGLFVTTSSGYGLANTVSKDGVPYYLYECFTGFVFLS